MAEGGLAAPSPTGTWKCLVRPSDPRGSVDPCEEGLEGGGGRHPADRDVEVLGEALETLAIPEGPPTLAGGVWRGLIA